MTFATKEDARWVVPVTQAWRDRETCDALDFDGQLMLMEDAGKVAHKLGRLDAVPESLYAIGNIEALALPSVAIVGGRKATPYGFACAQRFAELAVEAGYAVVSGGAPGVETAAHRAAIEAGGITVAVLAGGLDDPYPRQNRRLFRDMLNQTGAIVSEQAWGVPPRPHTLRARNRLVSALADAVLVVEAGLPSGMYSLCDEAHAAGVPVMAVPGAITSAASAGSNALIASGIAAPIWDDASFLDALDELARKAARMQDFDLLDCEVERTRR